VASAPLADVVVEGVTLSAHAQAALCQLAQRQEPDLPCERVAQQWLRDWVVGRQVAQGISAERLFPARHVAYPLEIEVERLWIHLLTQLSGPAFSQAWAAERKRLGWQAVKPGAMHRAFLAATPAFRLDDRLSPAQQRLAARLPVLRQCVHSACTSLSLSELWGRMNVQSRTAVLDGDWRPVQAAGDELLQARFADRWLPSQPGWQAQDVAALRGGLQARLQRAAWVRLRGLDGDPHGPREGWAELSATLTDVDIEAYYRAHSDDFARIESLQGWRGRCATALCAQQIEARLRALQAPAQLSALAEAPVAGWQLEPVHWRLDDSEAKQNARERWSLSLLMAAQPGEPPLGVRPPGVDSVGREWVQLSARSMGVHPLSSETVRYQSRLALTLDRMREGWAQAQVQWLQDADIRWGDGRRGWPESWTAAVLAWPDAQQGHGHSHD